MKKVYLGDSVYGEIVGNSIKLTTENGFGASNEIWLDTDVLTAMFHYMRRGWNVEISIAPAKPATEECPVYESEGLPNGF
jgi:hypothetical protein